MPLLSSADFFQKFFFFKNSIGNMIRVSNGLDPDLDRHFVSPDLGPNGLQRLSAEDIPLLSSAHFFQKYFFQKIFGNMIRVSNGLDPDLDRHFAGPDLGPNYLQRLSADDKTIFSLCIFTYRRRMTMVL